MSLAFLWNIVTSPRSTIIGLVGSVSAGAALLVIFNAMGCDLTKLTMDVLAEAVAIVSAPAVAGGVMRDNKRTAGDEQHEKEGGTAV